MKARRKHWLAGLFVTFAAAAAMVFLPVSVASAGTDQTFNVMVGGSDAASAIDVGDVILNNDGTTLTVKYVIDEDMYGQDEVKYCLESTAVAAEVALADTPQTKSSAIPGQFEYGNVPLGCVAENTIEIPLADLGPLPRSAPRSTSRCTRT